VKVLVIPSGYCQCGCGQKTTIYRGKPRKFISGHNGRLESNLSMLRNLSKPGEESHNWKGGKTIDSRGYKMFYDPSNGKVCNYTREHASICEALLGKPLPPKAVIHHHKDKLDNSSLVICEDQAYHTLLHQRKRAYEACGNPIWRKCYICKQYDDPINLYIHSSGSPVRHKYCHSRCERERKSNANNC
jgi:hypothetical protein